ncbi:MAG: hypothetical protein AAFQ74_07610 [Cyanobacteria bacterium J06623_4]
MSRAHAIAHSASDSSKLSPQTIKPLIACGLIFALAGLLFDINGIKTLLTNPAAFMGSATTGKATQQLASACTTEVSATSKLSREQLLALLAVPERDSKTRIREIVQEPYCQLSSLDIRAGVEAQREAYPLAFDPNTTLVILYENDEYAGYRFKL